MGINIPTHAFEALGIKPGRYRATELLSGTRQAKDITADTPFTTAVPPYGAAIWKIKTT